MECIKCLNVFQNQSYKNIQLTLVCLECVGEVDLITKTNAVSQGVPENRLSDVNCLYQRNPHRRSTQMRLYVPQEILSFAIPKKVRTKRPIDPELVQRRELRNEKRMMLLDTRVSKARDINLKPTNGIVCGDFLSTSKMTPSVSLPKLIKRASFWKSCSYLPTHRMENLFRWACDHNEFDINVDIGISRMESKNYNMESCLNIEGNRILSYIEPDEINKTIGVFSGDIIDQVWDLKFPEKYKYNIIRHISTVIGIPMNRLFKQLQNMVGKLHLKQLRLMSRDHIYKIVEPFLNGVDIVLLDKNASEYFQEKGSTFDEFAKELLKSYGYYNNCLLYTSPSPRDRQKSRMPSSA